MDARQKELISLAMSGDAAAFGELYSDISMELYRYALCVLGSDTVAQDAVQDAVCAAFSGIGRLRDADSFRPWLFKILSNVCKKHITELCRQRQTVSLDDEDSSAVFPLSAQELHVSVETTAALGRLSPEEQKIVLLSAISGFNSSEISTVLEIPAVTVRSKLSRALKKLRNELGEQPV